MNHLIIYFAGSAIISAIMFISRDKLLDRLLFVPFIALQIYVNIYEGMHLGQYEGEYFKIDKLGFIFLTVISIIGIITILHSIIYSINREESSQETAMHDSALVL